MSDRQAPPRPAEGNTDPIAALWPAALADSSQEPDLAQLARSLLDTSPAVPDALVRHCLAGAGADVADPAVVRLVGLAARRFLSEVLHDAAQTRRRRVIAQLAKPGGRAEAKRTWGDPAKDWAGGPAAGVRPEAVLPADDLAAALREGGIGHALPPFFLDRAAGAGDPGGGRGGVGDLVGE